MGVKTNWYKEAVVYQIYPISYQDSNNDGIGDIPGIISRLDYIKELGVTAIWFSPLYASPWKDYGYDISDYRAIHPAFGTMEDFDRLVAECHKRGLKVIMDMVLNHTSDQHPWFKAALEDKNSLYRDYYIIRKGRHRGTKLLPPTNWTSSFTGPAWQRIGDTDEFYLHLFAPQQPDLNWESPVVRHEIIQILKFWLDKGVDGFRFDVFNMYSKSYPLRDDRRKFEFQKGTQYFVDGPRMHEFLSEMNEKALSLYDTYTVGESYIPDPEHAFRYIQEESGELDSIFDFEHLNADNMLKFFPRPFDLKRFKKGLFYPQIMYHGKGWNTLVLENHDCVRSVSRFGINTSRFRYEAATFLATITFMGWGTPFIYQGEEIGMTNSPFSGMDELMDPVSHFVYDMMTKQFHMPHGLAFRLILHGARDHARTPMQWTSGANAGFTGTAAPWQSINPNYTEINVEADLASERSIYRYYQKLLAVRRSEKVALLGEVMEYDPDNTKIVTYSRNYEGQRLLITGNFSGKPAAAHIPDDFEIRDLEVIISNYDKTVVGREMMLRPYEAIVLREHYNKV
ncbi:MAG: alpha-glucosidase [Mogibacterium sp.]|nr:alpha-glucosidase [Mogibacterium sp.]